MKLNLSLISMIILVLSSNLVNAATIHGYVYDINFNKLNNAIIEINSIPSQSIVVKDSGYSIKLNPGNYTIKSYYLKNNQVTAYTEENILIKDYNGNYNLDLILFPYIDDNVDNLNFTLIDSKDLQSTNPNFSILLFVLSLISLMVIAYLIMSFKNTKKKTEEISKNLEIIKEQESTKKDISSIEEFSDSNDIYLDKVYSIIKEEKRINQKELRYKLSLSEAKISLIISQLESEGRIKKIKKGRGNIIIFLK